MAYERHVRKRKPSALRRAWLFCFLLALPTFLFAGILLWQQHVTTAPAILLLFCLFIYLVLIAASLIEGLMRPLQTLSNVVSSLREGDYSFRARGAGSADALGELASEINALADLLQKQRVRSFEATALLARILEVMHAPLFAFDREDLLAACEQRRCTASWSSPGAMFWPQFAASLGLDNLLASPDQTIHSFGNRPSRWLLRKAIFRQDGAPHTLLLLADVSQPLQEEEQIAWKRLIRVLGHELSNSLAPIKSIAGSLLARAESIGGDEGTIRDFRRGLSVVESRADSLHRFVQSYRLLAQLPPPHLKTVQTGPLLERVALLEQRVPVRLDPGPPVILKCRSRSARTNVYQPAHQRCRRISGERRQARAHRMARLRVESRGRHRR